jgi:hypothetical protein
MASAGGSETASLTAMRLPSTAAPRLTPAEGRSLALRWEHAGDRALLSNEPVLSELIPGLAQDRRIRSIIAGRYHYIRGLDGRYEMYDYIADPLEKRDLAPSVAADELPPGLPPGLPR